MSHPFYLLSERCFPLVAYGAAGEIIFHLPSRDSVEGGGPSLYGWSTIVVSTPIFYLFPCSLEHILAGLILWYTALHFLRSRRFRKVLCLLFLRSFAMSRSLCSSFHGVSLRIGILREIVPTFLGVRSFDQTKISLQSFWMEDFVPPHPITGLLLCVYFEFRLFLLTNHLCRKYKFSRITFCGFLSKPLALLADASF